MTYGLEGRRSIQLSYGRKIKRPSGRPDLNRRPPAPKAGALAGLRYAPLSRPSDSAHAHPGCARCARKCSAARIITCVRSKES
jgi:hypothetical protein